MSNPGILKGRIYQVIFEHGPKTYEELKVYIPDIVRKLVAQCINNDKRHNAPEANVFRIVAYQRNFGKKGDMSPIFGLGPGPDVEKPEAQTNAVAGKWRDMRDRVKEDTTLTEAERIEKLDELLAEQSAGLEADRVASSVFANMFNLAPAVDIPSVGKKVVKQF